MPIRAARAQRLLFIVAGVAALAGIRLLVERHDAHHHLAALDDLGMRVAQALLILGGEHLAGAQRHDRAEDPGLELGEVARALMGPRAARQPGERHEGLLRRRSGGKLLVALALALDIAFVIVDELGDLLGRHADKD